MAQKNAKRGRRPPRVVNGYHIRTFFPDFGVVESSLSPDKFGNHLLPPIPEGEIWFDKQFRKERRFLLAVHRFEYENRHRDYHTEVRPKLKEKFIKKGPPPKVVVRSSRRGRLMIRYVRCDLVRCYYDPAFIFGGHYKVYDYIPHNEVWLDNLQDPREKKFTLLHELEELWLMEGTEGKKGLNYDDAHTIATRLELEARRAEQAPLLLKLAGRTPRRKKKI